MYTMLAEQPILISVVLGILALTLLYMWTRGAHRGVAISGAVCLALIPLAWLFANLVETDEESIRKSIRQFAAHVEANDFEQAYLSIHPDRGDILARAKAELPNYEFTRARVGGFNRIRLLPGTDPREAVVDLTASVRVSLARGGIRDQAVARRLFLRMVETQNGWQVIDYEHRPVVGGMDGYSNPGETDWDALLKPPA